jgi:pyruvate/2-oxoglutarate dehydrogenase complex dihydrolipoamide acyltransferase (E2) component
VTERQTEALEKLNRGIQESRQEVQQRTMSLAQEYFGDSAEVLKQQIKENRATLKDLPDQIPGGRDEVFQALFQELMDNYSAMEDRISEAQENVANLDTDQIRRQGEVEATDAARRQARELGVDLTKIEGTGADGRIIVSDVIEAAEAMEDGALGEEAEISRTEPPERPRKECRMPLDRQRAGLSRQRGRRPIRPDRWRVRPRRQPEEPRSRRRTPPVRSPIRPDRCGPGSEGRRRAHRRRPAGRRRSSGRSHRSGRTGGGPGSGGRRRAHRRRPAGRRGVLWASHRSGRTGGGSGPGGSRRAAQQAQDTAGQVTDQGRTGSGPAQDTAAGATQQATGGDGAEQPKVTNAARRKAEQLGVDLSTIEGTGSGGLITIKDVTGS